LIFPRKKINPKIMNVLITGASGFLGKRLAKTLLAQGSLKLMGGAAIEIKTLTLVDQVSPPPDLQADPRVKCITGDLHDLLTQNKLAELQNAALVVHLAAAVSAECEANFDLGMRSNFETTHLLLQACRHAGHQPVVVFASSVAVFGKPAGEHWPETPIDDNTLPTPQSSYGIQKFIGEQLMADFSRKGFIHARSVRLMTVSVRPGAPNGAASGFLSGMIRDPLAGLAAVVPVDPSTTVAIASPARTIEGILRAACSSTNEWGPLTAMNLPSLRVTVAEMAQTLEKLGGQAAVKLLQWQPDPAVIKVVNSWPGEISAPRANGLGLYPDESFESIVRLYINENPQAIQLREDLAH
jgi:nucleoside-diphosphate-sugar epimerase